MFRFLRAFYTGEMLLNIKMDAVTFWLTENNLNVEVEILLATNLEMKSEHFGNIDLLLVSFMYQVCVCVCSIFV